MKKIKDKKSKPRKFKMNDKVRVLWSKQSLEDHGCTGVQVIRRFDNDYEDYWYYVSEEGYGRSSSQWLIRESELRKLRAKSK